MRVLLNITKRNNFVFFDPVNKVHMSRISPMAEVKELSPSIKRAILSGSLIDIDNSFGLKISSEMESLNEKVLKALNVERKIKEEKVVEPLIEKEVIEAVTTDKNESLHISSEIAKYFTIVFIIWYNEKKSNRREK